MIQSESELFALTERPSNDPEVRRVTDLAVAALQGDPESPYDRDSALDILEAGDVRVVRDANGAVAALYMLGDVENDAAWLEMLAVARSKRGCGLGSSVLACVLNEAHAQGATSLALHVNERNKNAVQFYRKNGFSEDGGKGEYIRMDRAIP